MQRIFKQLDDRLRGFIEQRDVLLLLVRSKDVEVAYVLKTIQAIDESSPHIFWLFNDDFVDPKAYVHAVVTTFQARLLQLAPKVAEAGGEPWPALPPRVLDPQTPPAVRLRTWLLYLRRRIADLEASRLVVALTPFKIVDPVAWRLLLSELVVYDDLEPWCHHMRLIAREEIAPSIPDLPRELRERSDPARFPSTEIHAIDLGPDALQKAVKEEVADKSLPIADRAQALMIDAMVDYGHQRYQEALAKYELLRQFFAWVGHGPMLALVLNSIGEVFARVGSRDKALEYFQMAVTPAVESKSHPVLLNISLNLGNLYLADEKWESAAEHYEGAEALATATLNAHVKLACIENIGVCHHQRRDHVRAQKVWTDGVELARALKEDGARRRLLTHLRGLYGEANMAGQVRAIDDELGGLA